MSKTALEMAREAGAELAELPMADAIVFGVDDLEWNSAALQRFALLVRADERNSWPAEMEAMERQVNILTDALAKQPAQQEPVGCLKSDPDEGHVFVPRIEGDWSMLGKALYTTPQAQRKPLNVAEVAQILAKHNYEIHGIRARYIVRMTEAAHGIKEKS